MTASGRSRNTASEQAGEVSGSAGLARRLRTARRLNVVLLALVVFLGVVVAAQLTEGDDGPPAAGAGPAVTPTPAVGSTTASSSPTSVTGVEAGSAYTELAFVRRAATDPMAIGALDAPVVLSEWTDTRCPFCAVFSNVTLPTLIQEYVDKGLVRIEFHDTIMFGEESHAAAIAARAAGEQGRYVEFMKAMYAVAPEREHPAMPRDKLIGFATTAGVADIPLFTTALDRADLSAAVENSTAVTRELGITSVPFFVVGDQAISGAQPLEVFRSVLDEQLALAAD